MLNVKAKVKDVPWSLAPQGLAQGLRHGVLRARMADFARWNKTMPVVKAKPTSPGRRFVVSVKLPEFRAKRAAVTR